MDPDATLAIVTDVTENRSTRVEAARDLLNWVECGGFLPDTRLHASTLVRHLSLFVGGQDTF